MTSDEILSLDDKKRIAKDAGSEALAAHVVAYKVLGIHKDFALFCMEELLARRANGDQFDFESYIDSNVKKMPKPQPIDLRGIAGFMNKQNLSSLFRKK